MLQIAPGTSSHSTIRLSRKGMKRVSHHGYGDHYVHIKIQVFKIKLMLKKSLMSGFNSEFNILYASQIMKFNVEN